MSQLPNTDFPIVIDVWQDSLKPPLNLEHSPILRIPFFPISTTLSSPFQKILYFPFYVNFKTVAKIIFFIQPGGLRKYVRHTYAH